MIDDQMLEYGFTTTSSAIANLLEQTRELVDLEAAWKILLWDQIMMPNAGRAERGSQLATLETVKHKVRGSSKLKDAVVRAAEEVAKAPEQFTMGDRALIREAQREIEVGRVPYELFQALSKARADNLAMWRKASMRGEFALVAPYFQHMLGLMREQASHIKPHASPYAVRYALFEPDLPLEQCKAMLQRVRATFVDVLKELPRTPVSYEVLQGYFPKAQQLQLVQAMIHELGYHPQSSRFDVSDGFTDAPSPPQDVRFGVALHHDRIDRTLGTVLHEMGHVLYAQGIHPMFTRTLLADTASYGLSEGQARFWETMIGYSEPFWRGHYHMLQEHFPQHFQGLPIERFVGALNQIRPSVYRKGSDELTYTIHIVIRLELECALVEGGISVEELPALWKEMHQKYLGVTPGNDNEGVLQNYQWANGSLGYFPAYTIGSLYAAQFASALRRVFPDMDERLERGELQFIRDWLGEQLFCWGKVWTADELCKRITGEALDPDYFITYVVDKYTRGYRGA